MDNFKQLIKEALTPEFLKEYEDELDEVVGLGDSQPKDDDEDPDDKPAHEAGSFATSEGINEDATTTTMRGLVGFVNGMKDDLGIIERELKADPELNWKAKEVEMTIKTLNHRLDHLYHSLFVRKCSTPLIYSQPVKVGILPKSPNVICAQILLSFRIVPVAIYSSILFATPLPTPATL